MPDIDDPYEALAAAGPTASKVDCFLFPLRDSEGGGETVRGILIEARNDDIHPGSPVAASVLFLRDRETTVWTQTFRKTGGGTAGLIDETQHDFSDGYAVKHPGGFEKAEEPGRTTYSSPEELIQRLGDQLRSKVEK